MSINKRMISIFLAIVMLISCCFSNIVLADDFSKIEVDGYEFSISQNNIDTLTLKYIDDSENKMYQFILNKMKSPDIPAVEVLVTELDSLSRSTSVESYKIEFDDSIEYYPNSNDNFENLILIDTDTNESFYMDSKERFAIPLGSVFILLKRCSYGSF